MTFLRPELDDFLYSSPASEVLLTQFNQAANWQERYRQIMLLGKSLPNLDPQFRSLEAQVSGCESNVWLYHLSHQGRHYYLADSDTRIVKGLIGLLLGVFYGKTSAEIIAFDPLDYFRRLGLAGQLSPSRTNGLYALALAMKAAADTE